MGLREGRPEDKPLLDVYASMIVERDSQKGIIIGHRGQPPARDRRRRPAADRGAAGHPGLPDLQVKVLKEWQRDPKHLNRLGF